MREPSWWYAEGGTPWFARALAPAGALYGALAGRRMKQPPRHVAKIPVVCVGNFTAGGTGKTPFVRTLLGFLRDAGHRPVVLSRGYGGRIAGPHRVDRARDRAVDVGDEPLLLAADAPVFVARDRAAGAAAIEAVTDLSATVIVMDDGLQNPALAKALSIAVVDGARGFGNGRCIPAGPLRAPLAGQLARVDAVVVNGGTRGVGDSLLSMRWREGLAQPVLDARLAVASSVSALSGRPVVAYAGIGVPQRFFATLAATGADVRATISFPDHHAYTGADAVRLIAAADAAGAELVTTEKDAVRLLGTAGALGDLARRSMSLAIRLDLDDADAVILRRLIAERVG